MDKHEINPIFTGEVGRISNVTFSESGQLSTSDIRKAVTKLNKLNYVTEYGNYIFVSNWMNTLYDPEWLKKFQERLNGNQESEWVRWSKDYFKKKGLLKC